MLTFRYFIPHLHLTLLSATSGSPLTALVIAARAAFLDLRIPSTKRIGWESTTVEVDGGEGTGTGVKESDLSGIKAAVRAGRTGGKGKGKAAVRGEDWDLDMSTAGGRGVGFMDGREGLPVLVTLNLVSGFVTRGIFEGVLQSAPFLVVPFLSCSIAVEGGVERFPSVRTIEGNERDVTLRDPTPDLATKHKLIPDSRYRSNLPRLHTLRRRSLSRQTTLLLHW